MKYITVLFSFLVFNICFSQVVGSGGGGSDEADSSEERDENGSYYESNEKKRLKKCQNSLDQILKITTGKNKHGNSREEGKRKINDYFIASIIKLPQSDFKLKFMSESKCSQDITEVSKKVKSKDSTKLLKHLKTFKENKCNEYSSLNGFIDFEKIDDYIEIVESIDQIENGL